MVARWRTRRNPSRTIERCDRTNDQVSLDEIERTCYTAMRRDRVGGP